MTKACELCKKNFIPRKYTPEQRFCSQSCARSFNIKKIAGKNKNRVNLICSICGKEYERIKCRENESRFCSRECQHKSKGKEHHLYKEKGSRWRYRHLFDPFPANCQFCNIHISTITRLEVHHKDKNRRNNDLSNLMVLCPSCHRKADAGTLVRKVCEKCGKTFYPKHSRSKPRRFCSRQCFYNR